MKRLMKAIIAGLLLALTAVCVFFTPYAQKIEEDYGLKLLFMLRGPRKPPDNAVIINIDNESSNKLGLSDHFSKWPRSVHAALVDRLVQYGAKIIAFDILFAENRDDKDDALFAEAISRAGNVILVEELRHKSLPVSAGTTSSGTVEIESSIPPADVFADAALAIAPFPLPKIPVRINQAWRFKTSSGGVPTLPVVAFQAEALDHFGQLCLLLTKASAVSPERLPSSAREAVAAPGLVETMRNIRGLFLQYPTLKEAAAGVVLNGKTSDTLSDKQKVAALIDLYGGESSSIIDFYGPPATITTYSYYDILADNETSSEALAANIRGRVVFVGAARSSWSNQKDGFFTVFSRPDGVDLSGVELAATVFSNITENRTVQYFSAWQSIGLIFFSAIIACLVCFFLSPPLAGVLLIAGILVAVATAHYAFSRYGIWTPVIFPVMLLPFISFFAATLRNYLVAHRERKKISTALGFYVPENVVEGLTRDLSFISQGDQKVYSVCLMTDAQNYTTLSESISPEELSNHMKEYYQYLFREVKQTDGLVCNVIGDAMLAHWPSKEADVQLREKACSCALDIIDAVTRFNQNHPQKPLPTRIGLHSGYLLMDNIGAEDHFEYAPVGDIVNTVSRIEGLNKHLGTQILASDEALLGVERIASREMGTFLLGGKTKPIQVNQLLSKEDRTDSRDRLYTTIFPEALDLFRRKKWDKALAEFNQCLAIDAEDGPSHFYKKLCQLYSLQPPSAEWDGFVRVSK